MPATKVTRLPSSRLAQFYEREDEWSAWAESCGGLTDGHRSRVPPGGDSQSCFPGNVRIVKVFWSLDASLAYARHFPAINWLNSFSLYTDR
jgi:V/A-type H+-transporting ATPase subunit A